MTIYPMPFYPIPTYPMLFDLFVQLSDYKLAVNMASNKGGGGGGWC